MNRPIHFEIQADNPERALAFYTKVFAWTFEKWTGPQDYWLIATGDRATPGIDGGLLPRHGPAPAELQAVNAYVCTIGVAGLDAMLRKVAEAGGTEIVPKRAVPGVGWLAYCHDSEGNVFGMLQADGAAQ